MRVERHVFGSVRGYATLARSAGLSEADCRTLESTSFGTPYDPAYRSSLQRSVAYLSRPLGGNRRAITRVLAGPPDDEGRPTLLFVTAVISAPEWDQTLQGDVRPLLRQADVWTWDHSPALAALELNGVAPTRLQLSGIGMQRVLGLVSLVELSWSSRRIIVVQENDYSFEELAAVERLLPRDARQSYSAAYRSLNPDLGVRLNCIAAGVPAGGSNPTRNLSGAKSPYALHLAQSGIGEHSGGLLLDYVGFGQPQVRFEVSAEEDDSVVPTEARLLATARRGGMLMRPAVLAVVTAMALVIGGAGGWMSRQATLSAPPPPPAWDQVLARAPGLATPRSEERVKAIDEMISELDQVEPAEGTAAPKLREALASRKKTAEDARRMVDGALNTIRAVAPNKPDAVEMARVKIDELKPLLDPPVVDALHEWARDRRRPTEERSSRLVDAIKEELSKRAAEFTESASFDEGRLMRAESLVGVFEILAALGEYGDTLVNPDQRRTTEEFVRRHRQIHDAARAADRASDQANVAGRLEALLRAGQEFDGAVKALKDSPNDSTAAEVVNKFRAFASQQAAPNVKAAMEAVADALDAAWKAMTRSAWLESLRKHADEIDKQLEDVKRETSAKKTKDSLDQVQQALGKLRADLDKIDLRSQTGRGRP